MRTISASEARQNLADLLETSRREPVLIQRQKRDIAVLISVDEYERLVHLNKAEFQRFCDRVGDQAKTQGLTEESLEDLLARDD